MNFDTESKWNILQLGVHEIRIAAAFRALRSAGIEPILFKGWAAAKLYPLERPRAFADIDLAVSPGEFPAASEILRSPDFVNLNVDLHRSFRHLDVRPWREIFDASILYDINGTDFRTPSPEDHLRLLCAHWLNDGGADRERLWDIYYGVLRRPRTFDWDKLLNAAGPERRSWVIYAIAVTHQYLGLAIDDLPIKDELTSIPQWISKTLENEWESGVRLRDLRLCLGDRRMLWTQIKKRVPPNPIQATIEMQKSLDDSRRFYFQARTLLRRGLYSASKLKYSFITR
jgi:hypothetical protein